jgi:hypothetical protein
MLYVVFQFVVVWVWLTQSNTTVTFRTGAVARQLTDQDVAALESVLPSGAKPWLLDGDRGMFERIESIQAYLSPTTTTSALRRGTVISVTRQIRPLTAWTVGTSQSYAQVAIPGRSIDQIVGDQDINRPFRVFGSFDNTELVHLVEFLRSNPPRDADIKAWPILSIIRWADDAQVLLPGAVEVWLRGTALSGQTIALRQTGKDWVIVYVGTWII